MKEAHFIEVRGGGKGRSAHYAIPDRLFATWYQMRYLQPHRRRIEMFVEVLRIWFDAEERFAAIRSVADSLEKAQRSPHDAALMNEYFAASLQGTSHEPIARELAIKAWVKTGDLGEAARALAEFDAANTAGKFFEAAAYESLGDWLTEHDEPRCAVEALRIAVAQHSDDQILRMKLGAALGRSGDNAAALTCFEIAVASTTETLPRCLALYGRALAKYHLRDMAGAITDFTAVVLAGAPVTHVAEALLNRGRSKNEMGDMAGAMDDYGAVMDLKGATAEQVAKALINRGLTRARLGDMSGAVKDWTGVVDLSAAPAEHLTIALASRGLVKEVLGDTAEAVADYKAAFEPPNAPIRLWYLSQPCCLGAKSRERAKHWKNR